VHHITIIGEAVRALPSSFKARHSSLPWARIVGMRNILVHAYFGIDVELVWQVVERDLPALKEQVIGMLADMGE
jgi:uncharacterized protein with HEPN domain